MKKEEKIIEDVRILLSEMEEGDILLTVGNPLREDDGVGYYIYEKLRELEQLKDRVFHTDQNLSIGINLAERIRPKRLIIIDGADFGGLPGESKILKAEEVEDHFLSSHEIPISVIGEGIEKEYNCQVYYIGIQIKKAGYGVELSEEVIAGAERIIGFIEI